MPAVVTPQPVHCLRLGPSPRFAQPALPPRKIPMAPQPWVPGHPFAPMPLMKAPPSLPIDEHVHQRAQPRKSGGTTLGLPPLRQSWGSLQGHPGMDPPDWWAQLRRCLLCPPLAAACGGGSSPAAEDSQQQSYPAASPVLDLQRPSWKLPGSFSRRGRKQGQVLVFLAHLVQRCPCQLHSLQADSVEADARRGGLQWGGPCEPSRC